MDSYYAIARSGSKTEAADKVTFASMGKWVNLAGAKGVRLGCIEYNAEQGR